jgi:hypothetical protein
MKISTKELQNIQLKITFPFVKSNDFNAIKIYQETMSEIMKLYVQGGVYISFSKNNRGFICIKSIVDFLYTLNENDRKNVDYPSIELICSSLEHSFENHFIYIQSCTNLTINLEDNSGNIYELLGRYFKNPPVDLKNLTININGNIQYILI